MMNVYLFAKRVAIAAFVLLLIAAGFYLTGKHLYFLLLVFAGILLAVLFCGMTNWVVEKTGMNRGLSLFLSVIVFFGVIIGAFWLIAPTVADQFRQLGNTIPQSLNKVQDWLNQYGWGSQLLQKVPNDLSVSNLMSTAQEATGQGASGQGASGQAASGQGTSGDSFSIFSGQSSIFSKVTGFVSSVFSILIDLLIVIVTALFFAASPKLYTEGFASLFPVRNQDRVMEVLNKLYTILKAWLVAMLISMTIVGVTMAIAYKIIGLPMAYALAVLAFFFEFIPNIGPWLAGIPAVLVGLTQGTQTALIVAVVFFGIQLIESFWLIPIIMKRAVELPPALLLFFQVLLGIVQGTLGLLLAAPLLAVIMVLVRELWIKDVIQAKPLDAGEARIHRHGMGEEEDTGQAKVTRQRIIRREE
ncbi:putative PurR-regulated permease PerM [Pontibacter ummariensis]|uniref:Predicted PurR-regulated permease PerM n=1 Tax=Pontibacter ummariensis TaxID=1610492 RepID=A0A239ESL2_9BACT|nr:AI-2E family transporter [Pontibacter ummariensis]PRY12777.1 putative PurR-regulated permease PerM [Pontibacter ummariensis]SNS47391.1 Predicted PurR-regulated permease PerM [Pontibacter ummariensis]